MKFIALFASLALTVAFVRADPAAPRIAVVSDAGSKDLAALLTTELSSNTAVTLLERDELAKVGNERKVQEMAGTDAAALGKLAGANGLLFLDQRTDGSHVRFTAVNLGYALFDDPVPPGLDLAHEAKALAHLVAADAPKLKLDPAKAIPLSVINLRADTGDAQTVKLERPLTLLLESRLAVIPEYVVLERRHAWSLGFEHSLDIDNKSLLPGAFLIDGTLSHTDASNNFTVHLRLRNPHGSAKKTFDLKGNRNDLAPLANQILTEIEKDIPPASTPPTTFDTASEADEYLHEALWGLHSNAPESALEAVDSAELLGASDYTVVPLRVNILCALADKGMEMYDLKDSDEPPPILTAPTLDKRVDTIERAVDDVARYRDEKMEDHLQGFVPETSTERFFFRTGELVPKVAWVASKLLLMLENEQSPRARELRQQMRRATNYDPFHGKNGVMICNSGFDDGNSADPFADDWAETLDEEIAWYHLEFVDSEVHTPFWVRRDIEARFCSRFLTTTKARRKAWDDFVSSLGTNPKSQRMALVLKTYDKDPAVASQAYRDYLTYLYARRDQVGGAEDYDPLFGDYWRINEQLEINNVQAGMPLLHAILNTPKPGRWSIDTLRMLWRPDYFEAGDAPVLWREIHGYEQRRNDIASQKEGREDTSFIADMDELIRSFSQKFPDVARSPLPEGLARSSPDADLSKLTISHFWHPWLLPNIPEENNPILSCYVTGKDEVFLASYLNRTEHGVIFEVHLPDFSTKEIESMDGAFVQGLLWSPDALYAPLGSEKSNLHHQLARFDFKTGSWAKRDLSVGYLSNEMYFTNNAIYLGSAMGMSVADQDCGLCKYDWERDRATVLASVRRRPAQNQFDDSSPYRIDAVFPGIGGKPVVSSLRGAFYIREAAGPWPPLMNGAFADEIASDGNLTLVYNNNGEATLIDPKASAPLPLMASDLPTYRVLDVDKGHAPPVPTPWAAQAVFDCPPGERKDMGGNIAYHNGHIYIFAQPDKARDEYELLYYDKAHGRAPIHIPMEFHLADAERSEMVKHPGHLPNGWTLDELEHPHEPFAPSVLGTNQGLCLKLMMAGFWFVPYSDIDAYMKSRAGDSIQPSSQVKAIKSAPTFDNLQGDTVDPADPTSFR